MRFSLLLVVQLFFALIKSEFFSTTSCTAFFSTKKKVRFSLLLVVGQPDDYGFPVSSDCVGKGVRKPSKSMDFRPPRRRLMYGKWLDSGAFHTGKRLGRQILKNP